jgi:hypothetical protein
MFNLQMKLKEYPLKVKLAILFLTLGWGLHLIFYFKFLATDQLARNDYLMIAVGALICYAVACINNWARRLCIFFNVGIIAIYALILLFGKSDFDLLVFEGMVVLFFGLSTVYLLQRETVDYFKAFNITETNDQPPAKTE